MQVNFEQTLKSIVSQTPGAIAALIMDFDGIPLASHTASNLNVEVDAVGMEYSAILKEIRKATQLLEAGNTEEINIRAEKLTVVIRVINETYFVAVVLSPDALDAKARYLLRVETSQLAAALHA